MDITQIDIYALECLRLVVNERSVTKAADKLGISQPSMSNVIARLRRVTGDQLIVRGADGMGATPLAEALVETGGAFLDRLRDLATQHETFEPSTSTRTFVLARGRLYRGHPRAPNDAAGQARSAERVDHRWSAQPAYDPRNVRAGRRRSRDHTDSERARHAFRLRLAPHATWFVSPGSTTRRSAIT